VRDEQIGVEQPGPLQDLDGGASVPFEAVVGLRLVLRRMEMDEEPVLAGQFGGGREVLGRRRRLWSRRR
jgi:hypothetical protein